MSYSFGRSSTNRLSTCHPDIIRIMKRALTITTVDMAVICGQRGEEDQNAVFNAVPQKSKARYGESPHNAEPASLAVDVAPFFESMVMWNDKELYAEVASSVHVAQKQLFDEGKITHMLENGGEKWGWDWPHWQIIGWKRMR